MRMAPLTGRDTVTTGKQADVKSFNRHTGGWIVNPPFFLWQHFHFRLYKLLMKNKLM